MRQADVSRSEACKCGLYAVLEGGLRYRGAARRGLARMIGADAEGWDDFLRAPPGRFFAPRLSLASHEGLSKGLFRRVLVVGTAAQSEVGDGRCPTARDRLDVIELEIPPGVAAMPVVGHEGALAAVALMHEPPDVRRNVPGIRVLA